MTPKVSVAPPHSKSRVSYLWPIPATKQTPPPSSFITLGPYLPMDLPRETQVSPLGMPAPQLACSAMEGSPANVVGAIVIPPVQYL